MPKLEKMVEQIAHDVSDLNRKYSQVEQIAHDVSDLKQDFSGLKQEVSDLGHRMTNVETQNETIAAKIIDMDGYMHEELATKKELLTVKTELIDHIEGLASEQRRTSQELTAEHARLDRLDERVTSLETGR